MEIQIHHNHRTQRSVAFRYLKNSVGYQKEGSLTIYAYLLYTAVINKKREHLLRASPPRGLAGKSVD